MINHARTLLMNRSGGKQSLRSVGEEYIPVEFESLSLPSWLNAYLRVIFGSSPDNSYRNYIVDRFLRIVHATEYEPYLFFHDNRITYKPTAKSDFSELIYDMTWNGISITGFHGSSDLPSIPIIEVALLGDLVADRVLGRMTYDWLVTVTNGHATVENLATRESKTTDIFRDTRLSKPIKLPGSDLRVTLTFDSNDRVNWAGQVALEAVLRPDCNICETFAQLQGLRDDEIRLFGPNLKEPFITFQNLWRSGKTMPDKLAGLILALVFRLHRRLAEANLNVDQTATPAASAVVQQTDGQQGQVGFGGSGSGGDGLGGGE